MEQDRALELFNAWFVKPIKNMDIDGGFIAFMVTLALYERLIIAKLKLAGQATSKAAIHQKMAEDLNLTASQERTFRGIFRNGLLHQGMPKIGPTKYWFHSSFSALPEFKKYRDSGETVICIDPAKFADRVLSEFVNSPQLIVASESFPLASVGEIDMGKLIDIENVET